MKKLFLVTLVFSLISLGCSQEKKKTLTPKEYSMNLPHPEINSSNFVEELNKAVKHYDREPLFYLRIHKNYCFVEILVNDYVVYLGYTIKNLATPLKVSRAILKSGEQKLTYRLYPVRDAYKEEYGMDKEFNTLVNSTSFEVSVIEVDNRSAKDFEDEKVIASHQAPTDEKGNFIASGKPYYEGSFTFMANVPYEINTLDKAKDLSKLDKKELEKKALAFNDMVKQIYQNEDKDALARVFFEQEKKNSIASYKTPEENQRVWEAYLARFDRKNRVFKELGSYKMHHYLDNKCINLLHNTPLDLKYHMGGILTYSYEDKQGRKGYEMDDFHLYMPKDSEDLFPF